MMHAPAPARTLRADGVVVYDADDRPVYTFDTAEQAQAAVAKAHAAVGANNNRSAADPAVDHPSHYKANGVEAIEVIEAFDLGFNLGNAIKYLLRAGRKGGARQHVEDVKKARFYVDREVQRLELALLAK